MTIAERQAGLAAGAHPRRLGHLARFAAIALLAVAGFAAVGSARAATIEIINQNAPGVGFNDPTPVAPVGDNPGTTLGEQRLNAFRYAADIWAAHLVSNVPIRIGAAFLPLDCNATGAVLGAAGAYQVVANFPSAPINGTWYPTALAGKLAGMDFAAPGDPHIIARFNSRLGLFPDCVPGLTFYLGLDRKAGSQIDLVATLLHEIAHGLGFQTFTDNETGAFMLGRPSAWDFHLIDNRRERLWVQMTNAERAASATTWRGLSWNGWHVTGSTPAVLSPASVLTISGENAAAAAGEYAVGDASFGPRIRNAPVRGQLMPVVDQSNGNGLACSALSATNSLAVRGNIALVDRGGCDYVVKARNVQVAGAIGMIVADSAAGEVAGMPGVDASIAIPSVRITRADGRALKLALQKRSATRSGVVARLQSDPVRLAGTDARRRMLMYTPGVNAPGSSVSHFTTEATRNLLMEPSINSDLRYVLMPPLDLTLPLLRDLGW